MIIEQLMEDAEEYTGGLSCVFCDGVFGEDEDGNETGVEHAADCITLTAMAWLEGFYAGRTPHLPSPQAKSPLTPLYKGGEGERTAP